jgi:hypothetical protein
MACHTSTRCTGGHEISVEVETGRIHGQFPPRALKLVVEWRDLHQAELLENWALAKAGQPLKSIAPLEQRAWTTTLSKLGT